MQTNSTGNIDPIRSHTYWITPRRQNDLIGKIDICHQVHVRNI